MNKQGHKLGINWDEQPLGKEADTDIALRLGVASASVFQQRKKRDIPAFNPKGTTVPIVNVQYSKPKSGVIISSHAQERYREKFPWRCDLATTDNALLLMMDRELSKAIDLGELIKDDALRFEINKRNHENNGKTGHPKDVHFYGVDDLGPDDGGVEVLKDECLTRRILTRRPIYVVLEDEQTVVTVLRSSEFMGSVNYGLGRMRNEERAAVANRPLAELSALNIAKAKVNDPKTPPESPKIAPPEKDQPQQSIRPELEETIALVAQNSGMEADAVMELLLKRGIADLRKAHPQLFTPLRSLLESWAAE